MQCLYCFLEQLFVIYPVWFGLSHYQLALSFFHIISTKCPGIVCLWVRPNRVSLLSKELELVLLNLISLNLMILKFHYSLKKTCWLQKWVQSLRSWIKRSGTQSYHLSLKLLIVSRCLTGLGFTIRRTQMSGYNLIALFAWSLNLDGSNSKKDVTILSIFQWVRYILIKW